MSGRRRPYRARREKLTKGLSVLMTDRMRAEVEDLAVRDGVSAADVIREALKLALPSMQAEGAGEPSKNAESTIEG